MNATVQRIVEIMFQNVEMNEEVQALKDELMVNCQDHFDDLIARGMDEDDAIAAVVDSLKGMEEVIGQYPKKTVQHGETKQVDGEVTSFDAKDINRIEAQLQGEDVRIVPVDGDQVTVQWKDAEHDAKLRCMMEGGALRIITDGDHERMRPKHATVEVEFKRGKGSAENIEEKMEQKINWFNMSINDILKHVSGIVRNAAEETVSISFNNGEVIIGVPMSLYAEMSIMTTSGDMDVEAIRAPRLTLKSTSGDIEVDREALIEAVYVNTTSGDVDVAGCLDELCISTISGDVEYSGECARVELSTTSGDAELEGLFGEAKLHTVSGDIRMEELAEGLRALDIATTSGDVRIALPKATYDLSCDMHGVSGDTINRYESLPGGRRLNIKARTVSGDVIIR